MAITSLKFEAALNAELERLLMQRINAYEETEEFLERVEAASKKEIESMEPFFGSQNCLPMLSLYLSPGDACPRR